MALDKQLVAQIEDTLRSSLRRKFERYNPEPASMPFHTRLLGKDRMALFSFIQSLNTNFGTSIFEPVAKTLALSKFKSAELQTVAGNQISDEAQRVIQNIMDALSAANAKPCKQEEIKAIRDVCRKGTFQRAADLARRVSTQVCFANLPYQCVR